jgi:hypothetical protein
VANLTVKDRSYLEDLLGMASGYVLNFTNATFGQFIATAIDIDVWDAKYDFGSGSKANRMRAVWDLESDRTVGRLLSALLEYIETEIDLEHLPKTNFKPRVVTESRRIVLRLLGDDAMFASQVLADDPAAVEAFLQQDFMDIEAAIRDLEGDIQSVIRQRMTEIRKTIGEAPLGAILLIGSTLEGILIDVAIQHSTTFVAATAAPERDGKTAPINQWRLNSLIDVAYELGFVSHDVKRFSHVLRDYRNFIHPRAQALAQFHPTSDTAKICFQVLKAAVTQIDAKLRS